MSGPYRMASLPAGTLCSVRGERLLLRPLAIGDADTLLAYAEPGTDPAGRRPLNGPHRCAAAVGAPYRQPSASSCTVLG